MDRELERNVPAPAWHRRARMWGLVLIGVALVAMLTSFPFIAGDPGPGSPPDQRDPAWFPILGDVVVVFLIVGLVLLVAPFLSKWTSGRGAR